MMFFKLSRRYLAVSLAIITVISVFIAANYKTKATAISWKQIDEGLHIAEYFPAKKSGIGDSKITILRINPKNYSFHLTTASEDEKFRKKINIWCKEKKLLAAINAGMYHSDNRNVGYMKNFKHINNKDFPKSYNSMLAFNRKDTNVPEMQIIDLKCQDWESLKNKYNSFSQSIRMIDCRQNNVWAQQPKKWSTVVWGVDKKGNALWIFCRSPYTVHDFINILLDAPIDIYNCMYLEGGPEASLFIDHPNTKRNLFGSYETGFEESDDINENWAIPNVIGIRKK
jgi:uncharacterized protein YigE (DUF2233 family)